MSGLDVFQEIVVLGAIRLLNFLLASDAYDNVFYWLGFILLWRGAQRQALGVPAAMIRAGAGAGHEVDIVQIAQRHAGWMVARAQAQGGRDVALAAFSLTSLAGLALYDLVFAQAAFLALLPLFVTRGLAVRLAWQMCPTPPTKPGVSTSPDPTVTIWSGQPDTGLDVPRALLRHLRICEVLWWGAFVGLVFLSARHDLLYPI